ncbi:MAG: hypothetical protein GEU75_16325 [Dehalococcoidia bacterium]|nr:hypothetical protein [Dehalococcoidia bacterium]
MGRKCRRTAFALARRLSPGPTVIIDARRRQAKRLRGSIGRAARSYARALGVDLPPNLVVVAQRVVHEAGQLNGLFQAFQGPDGVRRHIVLLALSVNERAVSDDELLAALRCGLTRALEDAIGKPVISVPIDLEVPRARAGAPIAEFRPNGNRSQAEPERGAIPIQRIEDQRTS